MRMKNGQLKPAYNIQFAVNSEYMVWVSLVHQLTNTTALIPFLKFIDDYTKFKYPKIIADAGYEVEENYTFLERNDQLSFIKPTNYEISKTRIYKTDIGHIDNIDYNEANDYYICKNSKKLFAHKIINRKSKTGYKSEITCHTFKEYHNSQYKSSCLKKNNSKIPLENKTRNLQVSKLFHEKRKLKYNYEPRGMSA
ncbi:MULTISPECIES: hypothetical protein [unclassified Clostridioides]|uniref:hypothetical protein n=1 Tax=unclassified Clostridioides TaxID=2635829 RepID=UPI001D10A6FE